MTVCSVCDFEEHAVKGENHTGELRLCTEADRMRWHFPLWKVVDGDEDARFMMAHLITKGGCPFTDFDEFVIDNLSRMQSTKTILKCYSYASSVHS